MRNTQIPASVIEIRNGSKTTHRYKDTLKQAGYIWTGKCWRKYGIQDAQHWENWCLLRGLRMKVISEESSRNTRYREDFFRYHKPMFGNWYCCAYCGKLLSKEQVQVDHIISVELAKKRTDIRERMSRDGWDSVNVPENLCAACSRCNKRKAWKGGLWIIRGRLGKKRSFQIFLFCLKIAVFALLFGLLRFAILQ